MKLIDPRHPFFRPRWRRWATVVVPAAWALVEVSSGQLLWAGLFGAAAAYAGYVLILTYPSE
ncbi:hypothetical protein ACFQXB_14230 [Plastorhodobacter daqingensis]|uniref:DUF3329 domain-containing protein n=1 Tax=Plastorhodobacter daqingensis TaxID=1387281 RepID=A0ABW2UKW6_9RHOB